MDEKPSMQKEEKQKEKKNDDDDGNDDDDDNNDDVDDDVQLQHHHQGSKSNMSIESSPWSFSFSSASSVSPLQLFSFLSLSSS